MIPACASPSHYGHNRLGDQWRSAMRKLAVISILALFPAYTAATLIWGSLNWAAVAGASSESGHNVDWFIATAAELQSLGKDKACERLHARALDMNKNEREKTFVLCRMLFVAKPGGECRRPMLGGPMFVGSGKVEDWPLEPIEIVDGVPFSVTYLAASPSEHQAMWSIAFANAIGPLRDSRPKRRNKNRALSSSCSARRNADR